MLIFFLLASPAAFCQISFGNQFATPKEDAKNCKEMRKNKTYFVIPEKIKSAEKELLKKELSKVWTLGELKFIEGLDFRNPIFQRTDVSFISFLRLNHQTTGIIDKDGSLLATEAPIHLWRRKEGKAASENGRVAIDVMGNIDFMYKKEVVLNVTPEIKKDDFWDYNNPEYLHNWTIGYLKNGVAMLNDCLVKGDGKGIIEGNTGELTNLKTATLHIPGYLFTEKWASSKKRHRYNQKGLFDKYLFPKKVVTNDELNKGILAATEPYYYVVITENSAHSVVFVVIDGYNNKVVFSKFLMNMGQADSKLLKELNRKIKK